MQIEKVARGGRGVVDGRRVGIALLHIALLHGGPNGLARRNENSSIMMLILAIDRQPAMDLLGSRPSKGGKA
jgi:hypothetical protein